MGVQHGLCERGLGPGAPLRGEPVIHSADVRAAAHDQVCVHAQPCKAGLWPGSLHLLLGDAVVSEHARMQPYPGWLWRCQPLCSSSIPLIALRSSAAPLPQQVEVQRCSTWTSICLVGAIKMTASILFYCSFNGHGLRGQDWFLPCTPDARMPASCLVIWVVVLCARLQTMFMDWC